MKIKLQYKFIKIKMERIFILTPIFKDNDTKFIISITILMFKMKKKKGILKI